MCSGGMTGPLLAQNKQSCSQDPRGQGPLSSSKAETKKQKNKKNKNFLAAISKLQSQMSQTGLFTDFDFVKLLFHY